MQLFGTPHANMVASRRVTKERDQMAKRSIEAQYHHLNNHLAGVERSAENGDLSRWQIERLVRAITNIERSDCLSLCAGRPWYQKHPDYRPLRKKIWAEIDRRDQEVKVLRKRDRRERNDSHPNHSASTGVNARH